MEFYSATKMNQILSFAMKWVEIETIILSKINQGQKAKNHMIWSLSYADFRPKTNAVILDMGHTLRRGHLLEEWRKVRNPKLESV
jgi:hypothetical protein